MLTIQGFISQFKYMGIVQLKFATATPKIFRKRGRGGHWSAIVASSQNVKLVLSHMAVDCHFLRYCWFRCCKCNNTYRFIQPYLFIFRNIFVSYVSRLLNRSQEFVQRKQKLHQFLYTQIRKNQLFTQVKSQHLLRHFNDSSI